jgi:hypothetical protein
LTSACSLSTEVSLRLCLLAATNIWVYPFALRNPGPKNFESDFCLFEATNLWAVSRTPFNDSWNVNFLAPDLKSYSQTIGLGTKPDTKPETLQAGSCLNSC